MTAERARDAGMDALRAIAVAGVVLGHWLVTALVAAPDGGLAVVSPLAVFDALAPATWLAQTLGLLFFVAGFAAARAAARRPGAGGARAPRPRRAGGRVSPPAVMPVRHRDTPQASRPDGHPTSRGGVPRAARPMPGRSATARPAARLARALRPLAGVLRPVGAFVAAWGVLFAAGAAAGAPADTVERLARLAASPLWFLAVLLVLRAGTGPVRRLVGTRFGLAAVAVGAVAVVAAADAGHGWWPVTLLSAWLLPYAAGVGVAAGLLGGRRTGWALLLGGGAALALLITAAGYPVSAVGVPGAGRSNLNPPSLAALALAAAQIGAALLARPALARAAGAPGPRRLLARISGATMGIYLWHQTAMIAVTVLTLRISGGVPMTGLHTAPNLAWLGTRLAWLPIFAGALWLILRLWRSPRVAAPAPTGGCTLSGVRRPDDREEVIAVQDGDPPSRGRAAARQPA